MNFDNNKVVALVLLRKTNCIILVLRKIKNYWVKYFNLKNNNPSVTQARTEGNWNFFYKNVSFIYIVDYPIKNLMLNKNINIWNFNPNYLYTLLKIFFFFSVVLIFFCIFPTLNFLWIYNRRNQEFPEEFVQQM